MPDPESAALLQIPLTRLDQPQRPLRAPTEDPDLQQLADSIRTCGILNPLIVDLLPGGQYAVVSGERRRQAAIRAGLDSVPAVLRAGTAADLHPVDLCLADNQHRRRLNPIDLAEALDARRRDGVPDRELAIAIGRSPSAFSNLLRLLQLPDDVQEQVRQGLLSESQVRAILAAPAEFRRGLADAAVSDDLSVRQIQAAVHEFIDRQGPPPRTLAPRAQHAVDSFARAIGIENYRVNGPRGLSGGSITIYFSDPGELDQITARVARATGRPLPTAPAGDGTPASPISRAVDPIAPVAEEIDEYPVEDSVEDPDLDEPSQPSRPVPLHDGDFETEFYLRAAADAFPDELFPPPGWCISLRFRFGSTEIWWEPGPDRQAEGAERCLIGRGPPKYIFPGAESDGKPLEVPPDYFSREKFSIAPPEARPPPHLIRDG